MARRARGGWQRRHSRAGVRRPSEQDSGLARQLRFEPLEARRLLATVTTLTDIVNAGDGVVSLREALAAAAPGETIDFAVTGTIALSNGPLAISKALTI